jgi:pseudouridine-5'-phosphate glycosidase/pseudouridine kinase
LKRAEEVKPPKRTEVESLPRPKVLVFGSAAIDVTAQARPSTGSILHTTVPGAVQFTPGGVGRNIAECASRLSDPNEVLLVSAIGTRPQLQSEALPAADTFGTILENEMDASGMRTDGLIRRSDASFNTAVCNLILSHDGGLIAGIADMDIAESITAEEVSDLPVCKRS